jgi:hypothetical protein
MPTQTNRIRTLKRDSSKLTRSKMRVLQYRAGHGLSRYLCPGTPTGKVFASVGPFAIEPRTPATIHPAAANVVGVVAGAQSNVFRDVASSMHPRSYVTIRTQSHVMAGLAQRDLRDATARQGSGVAHPLWCKNRLVVLRVSVGEPISES